MPEHEASNSAARLRRRYERPILVKRDRLSGIAATAKTSGITVDA